MEKKTTEQRARIMIDKTIVEEPLASLLDKLQKYDFRTFQHSMNVAFIVTQMACARGMDKEGERIYNLIKGATLHDIGKIRIPKDILCKNGSLNKEEYEIIKKHPEYGADYIKDYQYPDIVRNIILSHHERIDGSGYPKAITVENIPIEAQMVSVADVWDAITSERVYKPEYTGAAAMKELSLSHDPSIVRLLVQTIDK